MKFVTTKQEMYSENISELILELLYYYSIKEEEINLNINIRNISLKDSFCLYDFLNWIPLKINKIILNGIIDSNSSLILLSGKTGKGLKFCNKNSKLIFNEPYGFTKDKFIELNKEIKLFENQYNNFKNILTEKTNLNKNKINNFLNLNKILNSSDLLKYNFIDKIII